MTSSDRPVPELVRRQLAVKAAQERFKAGAFKLGRRDCALLAAVVLRKLGHKLPAIPPYASETGARRALQKLGANDLAEMIDNLGLPRIAPAAAKVGDLYYLPGEGTVGAITVATGNGASMGFVEGQPGLVYLRHTEALTAWSLLP